MIRCFCNIITFTALLLIPTAEAQIPKLQWINIGASSIISGSAPPPRRDYAIGFDSQFNVVVVFGGKNVAGQALGDTWILDLNTNEWRTPRGTSSQSPLARYSMAYGIDRPLDNSRNNLIIALGQTYADRNLNDVWAFDFNYEQWWQLPTNASTSVPSPRFEVVSGIDFQNANSPNQVMWAAMGIESSGSGQKSFLNELWALTLSGTFSPNLRNMAGLWQKVNISGVVPQGRSGIGGGSLLPGNRLIFYGGCNSTSDSPACALRDSYVLSFDNGVNSNYNALVQSQPSWVSINQCPPPLTQVSLVMNPLTNNQQYYNQAIMYGGTGIPGIGSESVLGQVAVADVSTGTWNLVLPAPDPLLNYPQLRSGTRMVATPNTAYNTSMTATFADIFMFGGQAVNNVTGVLGDTLNDLWILRVYTDTISRSGTNTTSINTSTTAVHDISSPNNNSPQTLLLQCVPDITSSNITSTITSTVTHVTHSATSNADSTSASIPLHAIAAMLMLVFVTLAVSMLRFALIKQSYFILGCVFYVIAIGFGVWEALQGSSIVGSDTHTMNSTSSSVHFTIGILILVLLFGVIPLLYILLWISTRILQNKRKSNNSIINASRGDKKSAGFQVMSRPDQAERPGIPMIVIPESRYRLTCKSRRSIVTFIRAIHSIFIAFIFLFTFSWTIFTLYSSLDPSQQFWAWIFLMYAVLLISSWVLLAWFGLPQGGSSLLVRLFYDTRHNRRLDIQIDEPEDSECREIDQEAKKHHNPRNSSSLDILHRPATPSTQGMAVPQSRKSFTHSEIESPFTRTSYTGPRRPISFLPDGTAVPIWRIVDEGDIGLEIEDDEFKQEQELMGRDVMVVTVPKRTKLAVTNPDN